MKIYGRVELPQRIEELSFWRRCPKAEVYGKLVSCVRGVSKIEHAWMMCVDCPYHEVIE